MRTAVNIRIVAKCVESGQPGSPILIRIVRTVIIFKWGCFAFTKYFLEQ
jgi:hypothetical protein